MDHMGAKALSGQSGATLEATVIYSIACNRSTVPRKIRRGRPEFSAEPHTEIFAPACCRCMAIVPLLALLAVSAVADNIDLPVATQGTEQWAGIVAKAMSFGGKNQAESLQAFKSFQTSVKSKMGKTVSGCFSCLLVLCG